MGDLEVDSGGQTQPNVQGGLRVPQKSTKQPDHLRTESATSGSYSFLDMYEAESVDSVSAREATPDNTGELTLKNLELSTGTNSTISARPLRVSHDCAPVRVETVRRDRLSTYLSLPYDIYGFKKDSSLFSTTKESYNRWFVPYAENIFRRKKKWLAALKDNGLHADEDTVPQRFPAKSDKVKKLVRRGIPPEWRGQAWFFYAGGNEKLNKNVGVYEKIVKDTVGVHNKDTEVIERDLNRTFPDNVYFARTNQCPTGHEAPKSAESSRNSQVDEAEAISSLRRVLVAFAHYQPQIGYCQSLNFLAGLMLLFLDEERAFWLLVILTERIIPKVHSTDLEGVHTDQGVLMLCIKEYIPDLWQILGKNFEGKKLPEDKILTRLPPITLVTSSWFMSVFVGAMPIETVLRVWDILWYEGSKTIFRMSLTICRMCLDSSSFDANGARGAETEQIELFQYVQNFPKSILDPDLLVDACFKKIGGYGYGTLSQDEINKCREFVSKQRFKLKQRKDSIITAQMSEEESEALRAAGMDNDIHDVYGFHRSIMSGVKWNRTLSNRMRRLGRKK